MEWPASAWLGLVPHQATTAGRPKLLGITKRGSRYLLKLVIQGATRSARRTVEQVYHQRARGVRRHHGATSDTPPNERGSMPNRSKYGATSADVRSPA
jgi:hypothetical protein